MTLWGYVGAGMRRLPVVVDFDADARVAGACLEPGASVPYAQRRNVERGLHALEATRRNPACLAGRRLALGDAWRDQAGRRASRTEAVDHRCSIRDEGCDGRSAPVCAQRTDGRWVDYRSHCEACRDPSVVGWDDRICAFR